MKTWPDHPTPKVKIKATGHEYTLLQTSEDEMKRLIEQFPGFGFPVFFAYVEKWRDGRDCDKPIHKVWPQVEVDGEGYPVHVDLM